MAEDFDAETEELVEQYLLFLRGRGPEPSIPKSRQQEVEALLDLVGALTESEPELPVLDRDPVAIRLGLVPAGGPPDGSSGHHPRVELSVRELEHRFGGYVEVDVPPALESSHPRFQPVATCTSLGEAVAVYVAPLDDWDEEPDNVAVIFRRHPEFSAVALSSEDAERAVVLSAADSNRAIDPAHGWLSPGSPSQPEPLDIALARHFERALPRWDQVTVLDDLLVDDAAVDEISDVVADEVRAALAAKPRLAHKKEALRALQGLDPRPIADLITNVQTGRIGGSEVVELLAGIAKSASS
jgi:hypothetical protein